MFAKIISSVGFDATSILTDVRACLLLSCPDRMGLVARVANFVWDIGGNINHADQHTDIEAGIFFQRVEFDTAEVTSSRSELADRFSAVALECQMQWTLTFSDEIPRVAVLVSRYGHCLYDLLARWRAGQLPCQIVAVVSNWDDHADAASHFGVDFFDLPVSDANRHDQEMALLEVLEERHVDLVVLARYMQILSPHVISTYPNRIINIHHSFLPAFAGGRPYAQAHARGVKIIGATAHYATENLDEGPIIAQGVAAIGHRDSVDDLTMRGRDLETTVLAQAVRAHLTNRVLVYGRKTVVFD